jgi:hypothetical protein
MAITAGASSGVSASFSSQTSWTGSFSVGGVAANDWVLVVIAADNINTTDADHNEHGFSGEGLTWTKLGEYTNGEGGAALGVTVSAWLARNTTGSTIGTFDFTATFTSAVVDKCLTAYEFSAGAALALVPGSLQSNAWDSGLGFGSVSISGLPSAERLYVRALAREDNSTAQITPSTNFTALQVNRSRNNADAVIVRGEFRINTSTGETSNPSMAGVVGVVAGLFFALSEGEPNAGYNAGHRLLMCGGS